MTTYIVTNKSGANLRLNPSTTIPAAPVEHKDYLNQVSVLDDWTATNTVGSDTVYLPIQSGNNVLYCAAKLLVKKGTAAAIVAIAAAELGETDGKKYTRYFNQIADDNVDLDEAWCTQFAWWCCRRAGLTAAQVPSQHQAAKMASALDKLGKLHKAKRRGGSYKPKAGDIVLFGSEDKATHTGLCYSCDGDTIVTIEGNVYDKVQKKTRSLGNGYLYAYGEVLE